MNAILKVANSQLGVSWDSLPSRVQEYISISSALPMQSDAKAHSISWCGHFVYWVLFHAGVSPLPSTARPGKGGWTTVSRFLDLYPETKSPKPGDIYYMPYKNGKNVQHVGFVEEDLRDWLGEEYGEIYTIDGNTDGNTAAAYWSHGLGGGRVWHNWRSPQLIKRYMSVPGSG